MQQPRDSSGTFTSPYSERRGDPISFRLPHSLDAQVRQASGWQSGADNAALRVWIETALSSALGSDAINCASTAPVLSIDAIQSAADRAALRVPPKNRAIVQKAFKLLIAELSEQP
jgi:hypothetical protein